MAGGGTTTALSVSLPTLLDLKKNQNPDGSEAKVVELLQQTCPMLEDMGWQESNSNTGHVITSRTALPSVSWTMINEGTAPSKSKEAQVVETCGRMTAYSAIDAELVRLNGGAGYRANKEAAFLQAFTHELQSGVIYHSTESTPEKIQGLSARFDSTTEGTCAASNQIVIADTGSTGSDQTSIWFVVWGENGVYGVYPKGTMGGLEGEDRGLIDWITTSSTTTGTATMMPAYVKHWQWRAGLAVEDWQQVARVCVDTSALQPDAATGSDLVQSMVKAFYKLRNPDAGRCCIYANRTVLTYLHLQALQKANSTLTVDTVAGKPITSFLGIPVKRCDAITNAETSMT